MKKIPSFILRTSITFVLLVFLFARTDLASLLAIVRQASPIYLVASFLLFIFLNFLILLRWQALCNGLSLSVPLGRLLISYLSSNFFSLFLPSTLGGDAARTIDISRYAQRPSSAVLATVVLDRVGGFFGLMTVLVLSLFFGRKFLNDPAVFIVSLILSAIILFLTAVAFWGSFFNAIFQYIPFKGLKDYLYGIHQATSSFKGKPRVLGLVWFLSFFIQAGLPLMYYLIALALDSRVSIIYFFIFVPVVTAISVIPVSIGGLGVRDTACVALFAKAAMPKETALAMSLANFGFILILGVIGGLVYVFALSRRRV